MKILVYGVGAIGSLMVHFFLSFWKSEDTRNGGYARIQRLSVSYQTVMYRLAAGSACVSGGRSFCQPDSITDHNMLKNVLARIYRKGTNMDYNNIGISGEYDRDRVRHLLKIGIFSAILVLIGDMLLGWGTTDETLSGMEQYFSRYIGVSNARIFWSALLGMIGIPTECLCYFAIYRMIAPGSPKYAHIYRSGIFGMLIFGAFVHVMCCAVIWHFKSHLIYNAETAGYEMQTATDITMSFAGAFLLPAATQPLSST